MKKERILKRDWADWLPAFSRRHRFRPVRVTVGEEDRGQGLPLLGLVHVPEDKEVRLFVAQAAPEAPARLLHAVPSPRAIYVLREGEETLGLEVQSARGPRLVVTFEAPPEAAPRVRQELLERMAYALYERRGRGPGQALADWLEAEARLEEVVKDLFGG